MKIDHDNNCVTVESFEGQDNIKNYVLDLVTVISENAGEREYIFKEGEETMKLYLHTLLTNENKDEIVRSIATRLLTKESVAQTRYSQITQIQKGIMLVALCQMTEREYKIIISKADYSEFLEESSGDKKNGLPTKKKIFKSFIANVIGVDGVFSISKMLTYDVNSSQAKYWYSDFLDLEAKLDNETNTSKAFNELKVRVIEPIKKDSKEDYWCLYNRTLAYMRSNGEFDIEYYANTIIGSYNPINPKVNITALKEKALGLPEKRKFDKRFEKVPSAIRGKFKTIVKLNEDIDLAVKDTSPNLNQVIKPHTIGTDLYIMIKSKEGYLYAESLK